MSNKTKSEKKILSLILFLFVIGFSFAQTTVTLQDQCNCEVLSGTDVSTPGATSPTGAEMGDLYVNTNTGQIFYWDGNSWEASSTNGTDGSDGVGITSTVDNGNGTFTLNYSDGSSFTTSDLTGPTGAIGAQGPQGLPGTNGTNGTNGPTEPMAIPPMRYGWPLATRERRPIF